MKISPANFHDLIAHAMQNNDFSGMRPVIEKEILHYDILFCLDQAGLLKDLVFQGGTCLRLCYGANRFSEDLDFAGGPQFNAHHLSEIKDCLEHYIGKRYDLEVVVKTPNRLKSEAEHTTLKINKWQIAIVTAPQRKDLPRQRIKLEVANIPAYTRTAQPLKNNYDFLPDGYADTLIYTETPAEIMADKLVALPANQKYVRHRDFWDLTWLHQQQTRPNVDLVRKKIADYHIDNFQSLLEARIGSVSEVVNSKAFHNEMKRFLPTNVYDRTLGQTKFNTYLTHTVLTLLETLHTQLYKPGLLQEPPFQL